MGDGGGESEEEDQEDATFRSDHCTDREFQRRGGLNGYGAFGRGSNRNKNEQMRGGCRCFNCVYVENQSAMAGDPVRNFLKIITSMEM